MNKHRYAVEWAQDFARWNRHLMMEQIVGAVRESGEVRPFVAELKAINCHHNYVARERHYGQNILVTRKGAVRAREGDIIPGSMGARCYNSALCDLALYTHPEFAYAVVDLM